jgi:collagen type IV alpha-3-binding protein
VEEHIRHADMTASDVANTWTLIASEGEMKVYKRDIDEASAAVVQHPLKAVHTVKVSVHLTTKSAFVCESPLA